MENQQEEINYIQVQKIFSKLPKGADLHSHFSSAVGYLDILDDIEESNIYSDVHFNKFKQELLVIDPKIARKNKEKFTPYFHNERNVKDMISRHVQNSVKKMKEKKQYLEEEQENQQQEKENDFDHEKAFQEYKVLGNVFYNIIKSDIYYENYVDLIYENMKQNNIQYQECRLKLDVKDRKFIVTSKNLIDYIFKKNHQSQRKLKIILQFGRWAKNLKEQVLEVMNYFKDKKRLRSEIIGIDFTGQEINKLNEEVMEDQELLQKLKEYNWQYYNHAGELIVPSEIQNDFGWEHNHNLQNVLYLLEKHQQEHVESYPRKIRVGHGIVFLQYLQYLENNQDKDENNKQLLEKYLKLSENICFEVCPFSNLHFYGGQLDSKIYDKFSDRICICTDDQNKMDRSLTDCFIYLYINLGVKYESILNFINNSVKFAGLEAEDLKNLQEIFEKDLEKWETNYKEQILKVKQQGNINFAEEKPWWENKQYKKNKL